MSRACGCGSRRRVSTPAVSRQEATLLSASGRMTSVAVVNTQSTENTGGFIPVGTIGGQTDTGLNGTFTCRRRGTSAGSAVFSAPGISLPGVTRMSRDGRRN